MRILFLLFCHILFYTGASPEGLASQNKLLDNTSKPNYGSFQLDSDEDYDLNEFTLIEIIPSEDQSSASPFEKFIVPIPDISSLLTKMISPHDQFNLVCTSKYTYKMMYPLIEFEVINQKIGHILRGNIFFADKIPRSLNQVTSLFQRVESLSEPDSQRFWNLCESHEGMIHTLIDAAQEAQDTPSVAVATKINDHLRTNINYLNNISNYKHQQLGIYDRLKQIIRALPRDRYCLLLGIAGFATIGTIMAITYSITTDQAQSQAFSNFMNTTEIRIPFREPPTCFKGCLGGPWSSSAFYINKNMCDSRWGSDTCPCPGGPNQQCYTIDRNPGIIEEYVNATFSEWIQYLATKCQFQSNASGYWPQYIQELANGTRHFSINIDPYLCAPNPDGESITCGYSYPWCSGSSGICLYFYSGSAVCAAREAWKAHLATYFAPTGLLIGIAIIGVIINWYCY